MMFFVFSVNGVCKVIKSDRLNKSSNETFSTPNSSAFLSCKNGSKANTLNCKPRALCATMVPIFPHPIIPKYFPVTSIPLMEDFSHLPS